MTDQELVALETKEQVFVALLDEYAALIQDAYEAWATCDADHREAERRGKAAQKLWRERWVKGS